MKQLLIHDLYIFSIREKKAKHVPFTQGRNIITSNKETGTKKGKSVVLKSIYHTLGADCFFEDRWNENDKVFILDFSVENTDYRIFRHQKLFKIFFIQNSKEIYRTVHRSELAEFLKGIYGFAVELPNKEDDVLEITPPAFNYLLNFIDQDKINGSYFTSFKSLTQYSDFKDKVLYYHFNVYNAEYYNLIKEIEKITLTLNELKNDSDINQKMLTKINKSLNNADYSISLDSLRKEIEDTKDEYTGIVTKLSKSKKSLIDLRNKKEEIEINIRELKLFNNDVEKDIKKIVKHECPVCHNYIEDQMEERIKKYNTVEDLMYLKVELEAALNEIEHKINREEEKYKAYLETMEEYEKKLKINTQEIDDILKFKGFIEIRETIIKDLGNITAELSENKGILNSLKKKKDAYDNSKKSINEKYYEWMLQDKTRFGLEEIADNKLEDINNIITAGGSNRPIATAIWYMNLLKLRKHFNPDAIRFPIVLDSPNNVETDDEKRQQLLDYIFEKCDNSEQLIVSTLGFETNDFPGVSFNNIIELTNDKYHLLTDEEYQKHINLFIEVMQDE